MSQTIKSQLELLSLLAKCKDRYRNALLKNGDKKLIEAICECVHNLLLGNINIDEETRKQLTKYKKSLRQLISKSNLKTKKKILVQKGGFLQYLLPAVISGLATYISNK